MPESGSRGDAEAAARPGAVGDPSEWAGGLFGQYGPCPKCGQETVTYSREFEESDLACYTCGHWLDVHETTAATHHGEDATASVASESRESPGVYVYLDALLRRVRSLF